MKLDDFISKSGRNKDTMHDLEDIQLGLYEICEFDDEKSVIKIIDYTQDSITVMIIIDGGKYGKKSYHNNGPHLWFNLSGVHWIKNYDMKIIKVKDPSKLPKLEIGLYKMIWGDEPYVINIISIGRTMVFKTILPLYEAGRIRHWFAVNGIKSFEKL